MAKSVSATPLHQPSQRPTDATASAPLVLASSSRYRAELLRRLHVDFIGEAPDIDETPLADEAASALVQRLALGKARALSARHPDRWILGSDQAAALDNEILGKPGSVERAQAQLRSCSGREVRFFTAVALLRGAQILTALDVTTVRFRPLSNDEITRYLEIEPALDCAGSFKCEGYGISLFDAVETSDPTALIGLPLISVRRLLAQAGLQRP